MVVSPKLKKIFDCTDPPPKKQTCPIQGLADLVRAGADHSAGRAARAGEEAAWAERPSSGGYRGGDESEHRAIIEGMGG